MFVNTKLKYRKQVKSVHQSCSSEIIYSCLQFVVIFTVQCSKQIVITLVVFYPCIT